MDFLAPLGSVYQAGTLSGNPIAMAAGAQALHLLQQPGFYSELQRKMDLVAQPLEDYIAHKNINICLQRVGSNVTLFFGRKKVSNAEEVKALDPTLFATFFRFLFEKGIYISPSAHEAHFISSVHTDEHLHYLSMHILHFLERMHVEKQAELMIS